MCDSILPMTCPGEERGHDSYRRWKGNPNFAGMLSSMLALPEACPERPVLFCAGPVVPGRTGVPIVQGDLADRLAFAGKGGGAGQRWGGLTDSNDQRAKDRLRCQ